eukprot:COSAG06_NODE_181_length_20926_cov_7.590051_9_plen_65_part_00
MPHGASCRGILAGQPHAGRGVPGGAALLCPSGVVSEGGHPPKNDARVSRARTRELSKGSASPFP